MGNRPGGVRHLHPARAGMNQSSVPRRLASSVSEHLAPACAGIKRSWGPGWTRTHWCPRVPCRVEAGEGTARWVKRPGHGFVVDITSGGGVVDGTGRLGGFAWHQSLRRLRDGTLTCAAQDRICCEWGPTSASLPFWRGPSGPFAWLTPDNRFVLADLDGWGCPVLLDAVWRVGGDHPSFSGSAPGSAADAPAILDPGLAVPSPPRVRG